MFKLLALPLLCAGLSMPSFSSYKQENHYLTPVRQCIIYDDENNIIKFDSAELQNYKFEHFSNYLNVESYDFANISVGGYLVSSSPISVDVDDAYNVTIDNVPYKGIDMSIVDSQMEIYFNGWMDGQTILYPNQFVLVDSGDVVEWPTTAQLQFEFDADYIAIKQAVELDIQANESTFDGGQILNDIVTTLVGGITGIATGIGAGVSSLVSNIFLNGSDLSVFGYMVVIFAGIALAIGLSRWVMNFLTSLGAKK